MNQIPKELGFPAGTFHAANRGPNNQILIPNIPPHLSPAHRTLSKSIKNFFFNVKKCRDPKFPSMNLNKCSNFPDYKEVGSKFSILTRNPGFLCGKTV